MPFRDAAATPARFTLTLWTDDPPLAARAVRAGIDRIGVDLERLGKHERQADDPRLWLSPHDEDALVRLRPVVGGGRLFARTNPLNPAWPDEVDRLLAAGVEVLMLPGFRSADDVADALGVIAGRALLVPLLETAEALADAGRLATLPGLGEVHVGLNDLSRGLGEADRFAVLARPDLADATAGLRAAGLRVAVGGIARPDADLPVPPDLVYAQLARLRATGALVARSFLAGLPPSDRALAVAVAGARARIASWSQRSARELDAARAALGRRSERAA